MQCVQFPSQENIELTCFPLPYNAPKTDPPPHPSACAILAANSYTPTSVLAQATLEASRSTFSELVVARE